MPGPQAVPYIVTAVAAGNVGTAYTTPNGGFNPGALPHPNIDGVGIVDGQYFLLARQVNNEQNGIWYADPAGPVPVMTVQNGLNPNVEVIVGPGTAGVSQSGGTTWIYAAVSHDGGPGFQLI